MNWNSYKDKKPPVGCLLLCHDTMYGIVLAKFDGRCFSMERSRHGLHYETREENVYPFVDKWTEVPK